MPAAIMQGTSAIYALTLYEHFRPLHANWLPGRSVQLGDFGPVDGSRRFQKVGNVTADRGVKFKESLVPGKPFQMAFTSRGMAKVKLNARGEASAGNPIAVRASLEVEFSGENAVFFNAAECTCTAVEDKAALGDQIMTLYAAGKWDGQWAILTDLVTAGATTIAISEANAASIVFGATSDVPQIDLANASIGLAMQNANSVGLQIATQKGLTPLCGLCKIQSRFLFWDKFGPLSMSGLAPAHESLELFQPLSATRGAELVFGQLH